MNVSIYYKRAYNNETALRRGKNKPNSNPNKANRRALPGNPKHETLSAYVKTTPDKNPKQTQFAESFMQNKANLPESQMNVNIYSTKDYGNKTALRREKNKSKQSQSEKQKSEDRRQKTEFGPMFAAGAN